MTISEIRVAAGQGQDEYSFIEQIPLPVMLQPGEGMQLIHVFRPSQIGLRPGAFEIVSDDPDTPVYRLPLVGTGVLTEDFLTYGGVDLGNDFVAAEDGFGNFFANNLPTLRTHSDDRGNWEFFLPAQTAIHVATFDPVSGLIAHGGGRTNAAGQRTSFNIGVFEPSRYPDSDNDGLPDDIEFAIGTSPSQYDTDADGQSDFVEIDNGQNPLDDRPAVSGIVSALATDGAVRDVILAADFNEPTRKLAYLAIGTAGMAIVDVTDFARPTLISQLALPGPSTSNREIRTISLDVQRKLLAAASPTGGVHVLDVADPTQPRIALTIALSGADPVAAVELFDGQIFIAAGGEVRSHNIVTGDSDGTFELGNQRVLGMSRRGYHLFVTLEDFTVGENQLRILAITPTGLVGLGAVSLPNVDGLGDPFLDDEVAWIPGFDRVITVDIKALEAPRLLAGTLGLNQTLVSAISLNGSGLAVVAGAQPNGSAIILQTGNPLDVTRIFTRFALPSLGEAVALSSGLAYLADGTSGLQVLSFLAYDQGTTPPTIIVEPIPGDVDPGQIGLQFVEMSTVVIPAQIRDDTQVRSVELLVDGTVVRTELSYPYDLSTVLPRVVNTGSEVVLQIRATDTGGNVRLSDPIVIELVPDATSPSIEALDPPHGSTQPVSRRRVTVQFSEPLDRATAVAASFVLRGPGGEVMPLSLQLRQRDSLVEILYPPLAEGDYQFITHAAAVTDRVGNALAATDLTSTFRVANITRQPTIRWTNEAGGSWDVAGNWLDVATQSPRLPAVTDDVLIDVPGDALVTFGSGTVQVNSIVSAERFQVTGGLLDVSETIQVNNTFLLRGTASTSVATLRGTVLRGSGGEGVTIAGHSRLDGATLQTDVTINEANTKLRVQNGLALLGTATISALNVAIGFEGTQTVTAGTFTTGQTAQSAASMQLTAIGAATVTFGADVVIRGAGSLYSNPTAFQSASELRVVNYGTIAASGPPLNRFYTGSEALINHGLIAAELESQLALDDKTWTNAADGRIVIGNASPPIGSVRVIQGVLGADQSRSWTNAGTIEMFNTNVYFMSGTPRTSTWSNAGTLLVNNTSLNLGGTFTSDDVRNVRQTGSFIGITGLMDNTGRTFTFTSENGSYYLSQLGWIKEGTIVSTGPNSRLEFAASGTLDGVTLVGDYRLGGLHNFAEGSQGILQTQPNVVNGLTLDGTMQIFHSQANWLL
ncbi:MAG: Ig-like domain-containing protein, partial [Pirellulaceae bacterium]|nr:Ig-like domain-containing protein [Pirellulaceae bacterium]